MENEDYRIVNLHNNMLKVYRDGRILNDTRYHKFLKPNLHKDGYHYIILSSKNMRKRYYIHRVIGYVFLGLDIDDKTQIIDHINRNKTNNNFINLRVTTLQGNQFNRKNTKGYEITKYGKFRAQIVLNKKKIDLGSYKTEICARYAYLTAKNHYHKY